MDFIYGTAIYIYIYISFDFRIFVYPFTFLITGTRNYFETEKKGGGEDIFSQRMCKRSSSSSFSNRFFRAFELATFLVTTNAGSGGHRRNIEASVLPSKGKGSFDIIVGVRYLSVV